MKPTQSLIDQLRRDKIEAAQQMTPDQRFLAGGERFDQVVERMVAGIRNQYPEATAAEVKQHLEHRLAVSERLENRRWTSTRS